MKEVIPKIEDLVIGTIYKDIRTPNLTYKVDIRTNKEYELQYLRIWKKD
jgi:exosome complex RNA-binding protein Rrp4